MSFQLWSDKEITNTGIKFYIDRKEVHNFKTLNLNLEPYFRPMLAQTEIKALVDSDQKDRWEQLSSILGQDKLSRLRDELQELRTDKKDDLYRQDENAWQGLLGDTKSLNSLNDFYAPVENLDEKEVLDRSSNIIGGNVASLAEAIVKIKEKLIGLLNSELGRRVAELSTQTSEQLGIFIQGISAPFQKLEEASKKVAESGHDHKIVDFLEAGISSAKPPVCPFCLQNTLTNTRVEQIAGILKETKGIQDLRHEIDQVKQKIRDLNRTCADDLKPFFPAQQELKIISQKLLDVGQKELGAEVQDLEKNISAFIVAKCTNIKDLMNKELLYIEDKYFHKTGLPDPMINLVCETNSLSLKQTEYQTIWSDLKQKIAKVIPNNGNTDQDEVKKWIIVEKISVFFSTKSLFIRKTKLLNLIEKIQKKLELFEKSEVARLLKKHEGEIKSYYERLNRGDKVQFSGIEVRSGSRRQAKLIAEAYGKAINPVTVFSEAHTNSLALSIYFPQRVDRNMTWEMMVLDDPVQSMDSNHSHALIDIIDDVLKKKQVVVLTHSKSFFRDLKARFAHVHPLIYNFFNNDNQGPSIKLEKADTLEYLDFVEAGCAKGGQKELEGSGNYLRKAIESICMDYLLEKGVGFNSVENIQKKGLSTLFAEAEKSSFPTSEIGKLKSLLDTSHDNSHAWSIADTTPGFLRSGIGYIKNMYTTYIS